MTSKSSSPTLHIRQDPPVDGKYPIRLRLKRQDVPDLEAEAKIEFTLSEQEQEELRWYLEDYLDVADAVETVHVQQVEDLMKRRGEELYTKVLTGAQNQQAIWFAIRNQLADLRIEIATGVAEAASIPWELMRDPQSTSAIALRVKEFVRVQSNPNLDFVTVPEAPDHVIRMLMVICRPAHEEDLELRADANRILHEMGADRARYQIKVLRPPTFDQFRDELIDAKESGRPYHIVHFDGHGIYADLTDTVLEDWLATMDHLRGDDDTDSKHGFLMFEHAEAEDNTRPVDGHTLGQLLHDAGVPVVLLNACQSAMHEATERPDEAGTAHDEVLAIGSLAQAVIDQGIPGVLGMRYSVYVDTAAQYIGELYASLAKGRGFGQAGTEGRKHLHSNPDRWLGLQPRPLKDWFVPVVYEAGRLELLPDDQRGELDEQPVLDPVQLNPKLLRYVPDHGFVGRDETLLMIDRAFDEHSLVLLHAYAGQGKTTTAIEFARWYSQTGGLGPQPVVLFNSFEHHTDLADLLNEIGQQAIPDWSSINQMQQKRLRVLKVLRKTPVLWIWDNVEPVAGFPAGTASQWTTEEQQDLVLFLKQLKEDPATKVKILLTSRRDEQPWLGGIPHRVKMPRMRMTDAAKLALRLGRQNNMTPGEVAEWGPLLDYCAGNPLTLRVIAGQAVRMGLEGEEQIAAFIQAVRDGEQQIEDADEAQGRDKSLGASLDYGFHHAFKEDELPIIALLHLFQGTVDVDVLEFMGKVGEHALPEVQGKSKEHLTGLLERASETGLLTHLGATWYTIHPALPWFLRQLFARHYPIATRSVSEESAQDTTADETDSLADASGSEGGGSSATAALRAWVEAVGELSSHYHAQFQGGNRDVIQPLVLEESNLLHARRVSRRHGWWSPVTSAMQGLRVLYQYQGRLAEWSRLVTEIVPDYCTDAADPVPGREDDYSLVMEYRVGLARGHYRDLPQAARLQEKRVAWDRQQVVGVPPLGGEAAETPAAPAEAGTPTPLDADQRNRIRSLGVSVFTLGQILMEQGSGDCVPAYEESLAVDQRLGDTAAEAISHYNIGHAYMQLADIRDLDAAEAAYERSLDLWAANDALNRALSIKQIGMVHHERFNESRAAFAGRTSLSVPPDATAKDVGPTEEEVLGHAQAAESHYQQALALCPATAITDLGPIRNQLGNLYDDVGQTEQAREHYEKAAQLYDQSGNRHMAGGTRFNMAVMYRSSALRESTSSGRETLLRRAESYAAAALRDFQHYEGRAADMEAKVQQLIDLIEQQLADLSQ